MIVMLRTAAVLCLCFLQSCITPPIEHQTASGKPEITIAATPEVLKPKIVTQMLTAGYRINRDTAYELSFDRPVDNLAVAVMLGSKYDSQPNARISFSFAPIANETRIVTDIAVVTNPGSAFERRTPMNNSADSGKVQAMLDVLKAETDPNSSTAVAKKNGIVIGMRGVAAKEAASYGFSTTAQQGVLIVGLDPGGAGDKSGLKEKDVLLSVAGKPVNSTKELTDVLASLKPGAMAEAEIIRDGTQEALKLSFPKTAAATAPAAKKRT